MHFLRGLYLENGFVVKQNYRLALESYQKGASLYDALCMLRMAVIYYDSKNPFQIKHNRELALLNLILSYLFYDLQYCDQTPLSRMLQNLVAKIKFVNGENIELIRYLLSKYSLLYFIQHEQYNPIILKLYAHKFASEYHCHE